MTGARSLTGGPVASETITSQRWNRADCNGASETVGSAQERNRLRAGPDRGSAAKSTYPSGGSPLRIHHGRWSERPGAARLAGADARHRPALDAAVRTNKGCPAPWPGHRRANEE